MKIREIAALSFDDCLLVPKHFPGNSRREIVVATKIAGVDLSFPVLSANMPSVTESRMCIEMKDAGGLGILHRSCTIEAQCQMVTEDCGAAIGIGDDWQKRAAALIDAGVKFICIDVAHGDQDKVVEISRQFFKNFWATPLIVGNIATPNLIDLFKFDPLLSRNIDKTAFKVGVGGGGMCSTRIQTGCGVPTLQSIIDCHESHPDVCLIADGGIRTPGDVVKSLAAGASAVMCGSLLAGTAEAPGAVMRDGERLVKAHYGNASYGGKRESSVSTDFIEGAETLVEYRGSVKKILKSIKEGLQSGISYCGSMNIKEMQEKAEFLKISSSGFKESLPHGLF